MTTDLTRTALRFWSGWCVTVGLTLVVAVVAITLSETVSCNGELVVVAEPAGWRGWPILADHGPFSIGGKREGCVGHGLQCGLVSTELSRSDLCPRAGVSLDDWFHGSIYESERDIEVHEADGVYVATGHNGQYPVERYLVTFRPQRTFTRLVFVRRRWLCLSAALLAGVAALLLGALFARRSRARAARYQDTAMYKPGARGADGTVHFGDGSPPVIAAGAPGPVLVRVDQVREGSYREAPITVAGEVVAGEIDEICDALAKRSIGALRTACILAVSITVISVLVCGAAALVEAVDEAYTDASSSSGALADLAPRTLDMRERAPPAHAAGAVRA